MQTAARAVCASAEGRWHRKESRNILMGNFVTDYSKKSNLITRVITHLKEVIEALRNHSKM